MKELSELIDHYEIYKPNKAVYDEFQSISNSKKREKFYAAHGSQIDAYKALRSFFTKTLGDGAKLTPKAWRAELAELEKENGGDMFRLRELEDNTATMATILYNVEHLHAYEEREHEIQKKRKNVLE